LKLPQLLSQFLYQTRKLDLPGIGSFTLDQGAVIPGGSENHPQTPAAGISFKNTVIHAPDDELIRFIQTHTGKMKPLAAADLDFFLTSGKEMLNVGKPFHLEGIGTLLANKEGLLLFTPGEYSTARLEEPGPTRRESSEKRKSNSDDASSGYTGRAQSAGAKSNSARQVLLLLGIIGGLIIIGWGGYSLYKKNTLPEPSAEHPPVITHDTTTTRPDTTTSIKASGSSIKPSGSNTVVPGQMAAGSTAPAPVPTPPVQAPPPVTPPGTSLYKFVILETTRKAHALRRYNQLLGFQLNIKMETKDSSYFKLYFPISATFRDTTHIKDSLADVYAAHVNIER
jgi:hypothetical protein